MPSYKVVPIDTEHDGRQWLIEDQDGYRPDVLYPRQEQAEQCAEIMKVVKDIAMGTIAVDPGDWRPSWDKYDPGGDLNVTAGGYRITFALDWGLLRGIEAFVAPDRRAVTIEGGFVPDSYLSDNEFACLEAQLGKPTTAPKT